MLAPVFLAPASLYANSPLELIPLCYRIVTMRRYLAFDLEIAKPLPDGIEDWKTIRPLGICCAATLSGNGTTTFHGRTPNGEIADQLEPLDITQLVEHLVAAVDSGYTILTWNGLGFDFDVLAEESSELQTCKVLALDHVDMMFHIFCLKGYPLGLDTAAKGMGLPGKTPGMTGDKVPIYWAQGRRVEILDYLIQDVRTTLLLGQAVEQRRQLRWTSRSGKPQSLPMHDGWLTVRQAIELPEPDTSWMDDPWPRSKFMGWLA